MKQQWRHLLPLSYLSCRSFLFTLILLIWFNLNILHARRKIIVMCLLPSTLSSFASLLCPKPVMHISRQPSSVSRQPSADPLIHPRNNYLLRIHLFASFVFLFNIFRRVSSICLQGFTQCLHWRGEVYWKGRGPDDCVTKIVLVLQR